MLTTTTIALLPQSGMSVLGWAEFIPAMLTALVAIVALYANARQFRKLTDNWEKDGKRWDSYLTRIEGLWSRQATLTRQRHFVGDFTAWAKTVTQMTRENENGQRMMAAVQCGILQLEDEESIYFVLQMCGKLHPYCRFPELDQMREIGLERVFSEYERVVKARKQHPDFKAFLAALEKKANRDSEEQVHVTSQQ